MAFLAYIAIVLVAVAGILFELDWLTKPKSETRSPVQVATSTVAPPPQAKAKGQSADLAAAQPKNPDIPQPVTPKNPSPPQSDLTVRTTVAAPPTQYAGGSTAGHGLAYTMTLASSAEPQPAPAAAVPPPNGAAALAPAATSTHTVAAAPNRCDVQACSSVYKSFRASDCTYQPFEGPRRICENPPASGRAASRAEPRRQANYRMRDDQATYRTRDDDADRDIIVRRVRPVDADDDDADEDDRGMERSRVIVIERPEHDW